MREVERAGGDVHDDPGHGDVVGLGRLRGVAVGADRTLTLRGAGVGSERGLDLPRADRAGADAPLGRGLSQGRLSAVEQCEVLEGTVGPHEVVRVADRAAVDAPHRVGTSGRHLEVRELSGARADQVVRRRRALRAVTSVTASSCEALVSTRRRIAWYGTPGVPRSLLEVRRVRRESDPGVVHAGLREQAGLHERHEAGASRRPHRQEHARLAGSGLPVPGLRDEHTSAGGGRWPRADRRALLGGGACRASVEAEHHLGANVEGEHVLGIDAGTLGDPLDLGQELHVGVVEPLGERAGSVADLGPPQPRVVAEDRGVEIDRTVHALACALAVGAASLARSPRRAYHRPCHGRQAIGDDASP